MKTNEQIMNEIHKEHMEREQAMFNEEQLSRYKYYVGTWNAAIEAAAEKADYHSYEAARDIRKLKK